MGNRPGRSVRSAHPRRLAALAALFLCMALVDVPAAFAGSTTIDAVSSTAPKAGEGTVKKKGKKYKICVPFFAMGVVHVYEMTDGGDVVDTLEYTVPTAEGKASAETGNGVPIKIKTIHSGGVNGSPSMGCFTLKAPKS